MNGSSYTETQIRFGQWLLANAEDAVGRTLTDEECDRLFDALGHSSIPEAIETIVSNVEISIENALDVTPEQLVHGFGPEDFEDFIEDDEEQSTTNVKVYMASLVTEGSDVGGFEWRYDEEAARAYVADNREISWYVGPVVIPDSVFAGLEDEAAQGQAITDYIDGHGSEAVFALWNGRPQYDENGKMIEEWTQCGECGRVWNDAIISSLTPAPSARCPFEYEHTKA